MKTHRWILLLALAFAGCHGGAFRRPPNPFDEAYVIHRAEVARLYRDASQQSFESDKAARDWLAERWKTADATAWSRLNRIEQKALGEGRWNPDVARQLWKKLALAADPQIEQTDPFDNLDDDWDVPAQLSR